jgi:hypothetical protein
MISARKIRDEEFGAFRRQDDPHDGVEAWLNVATTHHPAGRAAAPEQAVEKPRRWPKLSTVVLWLGFAACAAVISPRAIIDAVVAPGNGVRRTPEVIPETARPTSADQPQASTSAVVTAPAAPAATGAADGAAASRTPAAPAAAAAPAASTAAGSAPAANAPAASAPAGGAGGARAASTSAPSTTASLPNARHTRSWRRAAERSHASTRVEPSAPQVTRRLARAKSRREHASVNRRERGGVRENAGGNERAPFAFDPKGNI